jgi:hypothetical protein
MTCGTALQSNEAFMNRLRRLPAVVVAFLALNLLLSQLAVAASTCPLRHLLREAATHGQSTAAHAEPHHAPNPLACCGSSLTSTRVCPPSGPQLAHMVVHVDTRPELAAAPRVPLSIPLPPLISLLARATSPPLHIRHCSYLI